MSARHRGAKETDAPHSPNSFCVPASPRARLSAPPLGLSFPRTGALRAWLPRETSPAEVAENGQHNNDDDDDPQPGRHVDPLSLGACRLYCEAGPFRYSSSGSGILLHPVLSARRRRPREARPGAGGAVRPSTLRESSRHSRYTRRRRPRGTGRFAGTSGKPSDGLAAMHTPAAVTVD